jgi:SAM-dependent methyltransferase
MYGSKPQISYELLVMNWQEAQDFIELVAPTPYYAEQYRAGEKCYLPILESMLAERYFNSVLEVGPGYGTTAILMRSMGRIVTVIDSMPVGTFMRQSLLDATQIQYQQKDIEFDYDPYNRYDLIICTMVIMHLKYRPDAALKNIIRMMRPGTPLIVSVLDKMQSPTTGPFGIDWRSIPEVGTVPPTPDMFTCMYTVETFTELLRSVFHNVAVTAPPGAYTIFGECSFPKEFV